MHPAMGADGTKIWQVRRTAIRLAQGYLADVSHIGVPTARCGLTN